ncbi:hypothetical protein C0J52_11618 [Blattella germanica]|nr:hypothetical protein C0J52_11618 [Blattella germanica]
MKIPVYLSKLLAEKLFVYQYPVRPREVCSDDSEVVQSRIKPRHQEVSESMDTQVLESTRAIPDSSNYAVAIYHDKELHITPLQGVVHLRHSFAYLDVSDKRAKEEAKEHGEADLSGEEEEEAQQVTVKFARQENERMKRARERSFGFLSKKSAEEPWYHTTFHKSNSERAELERGKLYCAPVEEKVEALNLTSHEYMSYLASTEEIKNDSLVSLKRLPLADQLYLFTQNRFVNRLKLTGVVKLPSEEIKEILEQISILKPPNGWELKLPYDKEFIARYPEVVQRQHMWWEAKQKQLNEAFSGTKSRRKSHRDSSASDSDVPGDGRHPHRRKANRSESISSDNESGAEAKMNCAKLPRRTNKQNIAVKVEAMET